MQKNTIMGFSLVLAMVLTLNGLDYNPINAQFEETYYLTMDLINGEENQFIPGQMEYKIDNIQTNVTDLQGLNSEQTQHTGVTIDESYLGITALLNLPQVDDPSRSVTIEIAGFLYVTSIEELEDDGLNVYELTKTPNNYYIFGHMIMDGVLTQTSDDEATLSLRISQ